MSAAFQAQDTIAANASPPGPALRGLVRLSGPDAWTIALSGFTPKQEQRPSRDRRAEVRLGTLRVDSLRPALPVMIGLWPAPRTYTTQDVAEIHTVGSVPVLNSVLADCLTRGARLATPGEFTLRAFLSGRIDLTRVEAVLGIIDAHNPAQLAASLQQLAGGLSRPILALRDRLLDLTAILEANLDFVEESDVDPLSRSSLAEELESAAAQMTDLGQRLSERDRPEGYPRVVLAGSPNAGKSRLFNALLGTEHAIVSPQAGTTRDFLSAVFDCAGTTVELVDTAGFDRAGNSIETHAQNLRSGQSSRADLILLCHAPDAEPPPSEAAPGGIPVLRVRTKGDIGEGPDRVEEGHILTSALRGHGLETLKRAISQSLQSQLNESGLPSSTGARCHGSLLRAGQALEAASETLRSGLGEELAAMDLRLAIDELGKVVGAVVTDDILDRIFQRFCIGK